MEDVDKSKLENRIKALEEQLDGNSRLNEINSAIDENLKSRDSNIKLIKSGQLKAGDNIISGLNGDFVDNYRLVLDFYVINEYMADNYIAINNEITDTDMTFVKTEDRYTTGAPTTSTTGGLSVHEIDIDHSTAFAPRYHGELNFHMKKANSNDNRRMVHLVSYVSGNGLAGQMTGTWTIRYADTLNMTSLNIYIANTIGDGGTYKFYKL